jgi:hypothetical protein
MPPLEPRTVLDATTGLTMTVVDQPLVLARERRDVAVKARDYLTMVAAEINESGRRRLVWVVHQWSTIDSRVADFQPTPGETLMLVADGRDIRLQQAPQSLAAAMARSPDLLPPEDVHAQTTLYAIDAATLHYLATSTRLTASFPESRLTLPFTLWTDGRAAVIRLLEQTGNLN